MSHHHLLTGASVAAVLAVGTPALADFVILDDLIVDGSACIGFDCVNGESFGFDTIRLKENNLRIKFEDTSSTASFPTTDWTLVANDSANGGQNKFSILDSSTNRTVFTVEGNAPTNSLYVDDGGRVGLGTSIPVADIHIKDGDTPTVRLEQDGTSGFSPQTFDVAGNEANFFVRDATNGSTLPFRIRPGAPSNALYVDPDGNVGIGTPSPDSPLTIERSDAPFMSLNSTADSLEWFISYQDAAPNALIIGRSDAGGESMFIRADGSMQMGGDGTAGNGMALDATGNMDIGGTLTENSDKNSKMAIEPVDTRAILDKVAGLEVSEWTYIADAESGVRHIGPMAQDFYAAFGTGARETGISSLDTSGVAIAAIQALVVENAELRARIERLEAAE